MTDFAANRPTVVIAHENAGIRAWIALALRALGTVSELESGDELELLVLSEHAPSLVVASSTLTGKTGMQVLAATRAAGRMTPFVIVSEFSAGHLLALVSEPHGTRVARRVLGRHGLRSLALRLVGQSAPHPPPLSN